MTPPNHELNFIVKKDRASGLYYANFVTSKKVKKEPRYGPFKTSKAAKQEMQKRITSFLAEAIKGELMADFISEKLEEAELKNSGCVTFKKVHDDAVLPLYATALAVGADLHAVITLESGEEIIEPGKRKLIKTGLALANMDADFELQVRPRSGLALKHGITVLNTPGTIDPDYRGEIGVILYNTGDQPFSIRTGDRIAQLVAAKRHELFFVFGEGTSATERGEGGFGSTGQ